MRLLKKARQRIQEFIRAVKRPDRALIASVIPRKRPSLAQIQHVDLFLDTWEKNLIGALGFIALISFIGIFWSLRILNTVPGPAEGGDFQEVLIGSPRHINPIFAVTDTDRTLTNIVFLPLCDSYNRNIPALSTCDFSNLKSITVKLGDRTWHDGEVITADDIVFSIQTMQTTAVGSPWRALASRVTVTKNDDKTVTISSKQPIPEIKTLLSLGIIPKHLWSSIEPAQMMISELNLKPVGSGPYEYNTSVIDTDGYVQNIDLDAFADFKPHRAYIDELDFRIATDDVEAYDLFRTRQVDAFFVHDPAQTEELVKRDVRRYEISPSVVVSLFFNPTRNAALRKKDVRQAFALGIDRTALIKDVLKGNGIPTHAPLPATILKEPKTVQSDLNPAQASELLKKNAFSESKPLTLTLGIPALPTYQTLAENLKAQLAPLGIVINPSIIGSGTKTGSLLSYDLLLLGQDYGLSGNPFPFWHTSTSGENGTNYARYQIKEVDSWLEQFQADGRPETQENLLNKLNQRLVNDSPAIFLYQPTYQYYVANKVLGISVPTNCDPTERFAFVANWYTNTARIPR